MKIIFSDECLKYSQEGHSECPKRVENSYNLLKEKGFEFVKPGIANEKDILRVHTKKHKDDLEAGNFFDFDSPNYDHILYYACLSAGAAITAMDYCFDDYTFSLMRPPGHHAGKDKIMGFCYFNNVAIAVAKALASKKLKKVAIIDIDIHHGNGTQNIFLGDERVLYISLHQFPLYPGTGEFSKDNCLNYPLPAGTTEEKYLAKLKSALKKVKDFNPDMIAVSTGLDTYEKDPLGGFKLKYETYEKIGRLIKSLNKPTFSVLEGGYSPTNVPICLYNYLKGFE